MCPKIPRRPYSNGRSTLFGDTDNIKSKILQARKALKNKKNRSVKFNLEVTVQPIKASPSPYSTWLSPNEYDAIQNGVGTTLNLMELQLDDFEFMPSSSQYCRRGLEKFSMTQKGSLKPDVTLRRQSAIRAVMTEQESQRQSAATATATATATNNNGKHFYSDIKMRDACRSNYNRLTTLKAVEMGLFDSEAALAVYSEQQQQKQQAMTDVTNLFQTERKKRIAVPQLTTMLPTRSNPPIQKNVVNATTA